MRIIGIWFLMMAGLLYGTTCPVRIAKAEAGSPDRLVDTSKATRDRTQPIRVSAIFAFGKVDFYNKVKGYGFIINEAGGPHILVLKSAVEAAGLKTLEAGMCVTYDIETGPNGKVTAVNLSVEDC